MFANCAFRWFNEHVSNTGLFPVKVSCYSAVHIFWRVSNCNFGFAHHQCHVPRSTYTTIATVERIYQKIDNFELVTQSLDKKDG